MARRKAKATRDRYKYSTSQLLNFARDSYLERTSRPVYAIVFLLPFICFYELGTIFINTDVLNQSQVRVVAFVWLQDLLRYLGCGSKLAWIAPPLIVVVILVGLQLASRKRWYFCLSDLGPMAIECVLLAVPLIVLSLFLNQPIEIGGDTGQFVNSVAPAHSEPRHEVLMLAADTALSPAADAPGESLMASVVTGIGAGIYEELVFRLILICLLMLLFQDLIGLSHENSIVLSVLISAGLFSAHHHVVLVDGRLGTSAPFTWTEFGFRTLAGIYFAVIFAIRGFGITAGSHAFYDIIATIINAVFFQR